MAVVDSTKTEPEPMQVEKAVGSSASAKPKPDAELSKGEKRKPEESPAEASDAKRIKSIPVEPAVLRKQVEYYLSDQNLSTDKFFHDKIKADPEGWLDMNLVLSCNKMKAIRATQQAVIDALMDSIIEVREAKEGVVAAVRRPENKALPELQEKQGGAQFQKKKLHAHDGGCIVAVKGIPEEQNWMQVKDSVRTKLPEKVSIMFASQVSEKNQCVLAITPFDGDLQLFENLIIEVGGAKLKVEVCHAESLQQALKLLPKNVRERREKMARQRQKERQKAIIIANQKFPNVGAVRTKVKAIIQARSDGEQLNPEGGEYKLIHALLMYHPRASEKTQGMTGIKIDESSMGGNRCFWIVRGDMHEDFSANKCLAALELNPPYEMNTPPKVKASNDATSMPSEKTEGDAPTQAKTEVVSIEAKKVEVASIEAKKDEIAPVEAKKEDVAPVEAKKDEASSVEAKMDDAATVETKS